MTSRRLGVWLAGALCLVLVVLVIDSSGIVSDETAVIVDDGAQLAAGVAATLACWWGARRTRGAERGWRTLMAVGMGGWSAGMAVWSWYQIVLDTPLPCPSVADVGFLTMPVMALPALLSLSRGTSRHPHAPQRHASLVDVLDGLVVVGSLFVMAWATALGSVVRAEAPSTAAFLVALAYPATDLMLVVIVTLLVVTRRVPDALRTQLWLLGAGLVAISVSDSIFAYLISIEADEMPPLTNAGFIAGPLLIAIAGAAVAPPAPVPEGQGATAGRRIERAHLLLPYALVGVTGTVIAVQAVIGARIDAVEAVVAFAVVALVLVRQMITLVQNTALLEHVSAARAQLAHEAHHDPLTGLANRALFGERLDRAVHRHRDEGRRFALVIVDLDDFKAVNDTLGHSAGDRVLHAVGGRLRGCVRGSDTVARLGGDEFAVVLDAPPDEPRAVAERILRALRQPFEVGGTLVTVTASVGVVEPTDGAALTPDAVMHRADAAMYVGKRRGKDTAVVDGSDGSADLTTARG